MREVPHKIVATTLEDRPVPKGLRAHATPERNKPDPWGEATLLG